MRKKAQPNGIVVAGVYDGSPADFGDSTKLLPYIVEVEEMERIVRVVKGRTIFISVRQNPIARDQTDAGPGDTMTYKVYGHLTVSKNEALRFIKNAYDARVRELSRARLTISNTCLFIG